MTCWRSSESRTTWTTARCGASKTRPNRCQHEHKASGARVGCVSSDPQRAQRTAAAAPIGHVESCRRSAAVPGCQRLGPLGHAASVTGPARPCHGPNAAAFTPCVRLRSPPAPRPPERPIFGRRDPPVTWAGSLVQTCGAQNAPRRPIRTQANAPPRTPAPNPNAHRQAALPPRRLSEPRTRPGQRSANISLVVPPDWNALTRRPGSASLVEADDYRHDSARRREALPLGHVLLEHLEQRDLPLDVLELHAELEGCGTVYASAGSESA